MNNRSKKLLCTTGYKHFLHRKKSRPIFHLLQVQVLSPIHTLLSAHKSRRPHLFPARFPGVATATAPPSTVSVAPTAPPPMADRYRAYAPASSHERDPHVDYPRYVPSAYYTSPATGLPGDYTSRALAPGSYASREPIAPVDYTSRALALGSYASREPIAPGDYTFKAPILLGDYASRPPVLPGGPDIIGNDVALQSRAYGLDGPAGVSNPALSGMSGLAAGARAPGPSPLESSPLAGRSGLAPVMAPVEDPALVRRSSSVGNKSVGIPDVEHQSSLSNLDGPSEDESNILFVDGLPSDCTRREIAHLFRPFVGFKDIRVVHKEPRRSGDKAYVLCFVEFENAKCAFTAMEALQGYCFDDRKPDAPVLKIHFARFPFRLPAAEGDKRHTVMH